MNSLASFPSSQAFICFMRRVLVKAFAVMNNSFEVVGPDSFYQALNIVIVWLNLYLLPLSATQAHPGGT